MSGDDRDPSGPRGNKTVFRPSPLQSLKQGNVPPGGAPPVPSGAWGEQTPPEPPPAASGYDHFASQPEALAYAGPDLAPSRLSEDDVPLPATPRKVRSVMLAEAGPVLAMAAGVRSGRLRMPMPQFHRAAGQAIAAFERAIAPHYPAEARQRAKYALCATVDDIAQNLPGLGTDGAEWARRSLVVQFFQENIGGDRFWQLVDDMLRSPAQNGEMIELYHACLAAGFEGRFRVMPDGRRRLHEIMARLQGALDHVRSLSALEIVPNWRGEDAPVRRVGFWSHIALAAAAAAGLLFLIYAVLAIILVQTGRAPMEALTGLIPADRLGLTRAAAAPSAPAASAQASRLRRFLQSEIEQNLVKVDEDAQTVRVRTTVGQLFQSGSDQLEPERRALFERIGRAVQEEAGPVIVEGHADTDRVSSPAFPDNMALSSARAETVAALIRNALTDPARVTARGMGENVPIASNDTPDGKSLNRRVEIVVQRR